MPERNPVILPKPLAKKTGCPVCGHAHYTGRNVGGVITRTCCGCGNQWQGGLPQLPQDPTVPRPYTPAPAVDFLPIRNQRGEVIGTEELRQRQDLTQDFRKGAPVPVEGED